MLFRAIVAQKTRNLRQEVNLFPVHGKCGSWDMGDNGYCDKTLWEPQFHTAAAK